VKTQIGLNWLMQARRGERRLDWLSAGDAAAL
jgi:hypothetical protein